MAKKPKIVFGNNISAKVKSATFWTGMIPVIATFVVSICSLFGVQVAEDIVNQYTAIGTTIISILTGFGVLVSHDTKGASDSPIVKTFDKPRDYSDPKQALEFSNRLTTENKSTLSNDELKEQYGILKPQEYDTNKPFSDDSDEIGFDVNTYETDEDEQQENLLKEKRNSNLGGGL